MCDTLVAPANATADGAVIFAKNSDREPNEAHHLITVPAQNFPSGSQLQCTYVSIPQVDHTYSVLLAKPFWIWGAEMGANEHGVVIGNEAVFTRVPVDKEPGLIGMDFLRLALERAATALDALKVITDLLEKYGQSGNCGFTHGFYYHNSFLIADASDAWVLETAGKHWAAEHVSGIRTISNALTITNHWDLASTDLVNFAIEKKWCKRREDFQFARCYSDTLYTRLSDAAKRQCATTTALQGQQGKITIQDAFQILRSHAQPANGSYRPDRGITGADVCMHAGYGPVRNSQSTGSMVSHLLPGEAVHWVTGTSAPCTGIFKPVWLDAGLLDTGPTPAGSYQPESLWWQHEILHREVLRDYSTRLAQYQSERDSLEEEFVLGVERLHGQPASDRAAYSLHCFESAAAAELIWLENVIATKLTGRLRVPYALAWKGFHRQAKLGQ